VRLIWPTTPSTSCIFLPHELMKLSVRERAAIYAMIAVQRGEGEARASAEQGEKEIGGGGE
jgi:hypothetical protein